MHRFERHLLRACRGLIQPGARVIVALSGGADSSALLAGLAALRERLGLADLEAAHLDHGLRGEEARRDAQAAQALAERLGVAFTAGQADALAELRTTDPLAAGGSLEAAARRVRYRFLAGLARQRGAARVAVAHTADDQVETVLSRLVRGAGLPGLAGIPRSRPLREERGEPAVARVVRPLLGLRRADVLEYLRDRGLTWVEDGSNADRRFLRARVRHELLPQLRGLGNPATDEALLRLARQARRARRHLDRQARELLARAGQGPDGPWSLAALLTADPAVRAAALHRLLRGQTPARASAAHVEALLRLVRRGQGEATLPGARRWSAQGGWLSCGLATPQVAAPDERSILLPIPGQALDPAAGLLFTTRLAAWTADAPPLDDPACAATLDAERLTGSLALRRRRSGDRFWPLGAAGGRSLKRFFNDRKVPRPERASVPVVTFDDHPVWIVGHRIDERYKVTPATRRVLHIEARRVRGEDEGSGL